MLGARQSPMRRGRWTRAEELWACPLASSRGKGELCTRCTSGVECRQRTEATLEPAGRWLWEQLAGRAQVPHRSSGLDVNPW